MARLTLAALVQVQQAMPRLRPAAADMPAVAHHKVVADMPVAVGEDRTAAAVVVDTGNR
jgi:hypothetical protein